MSETPTFTDKDLTNMVRGFDAPEKQDLLKKLREQARQREEEAERASRAEDNQSLDDLFERKNKQRDQERGMDR